MAAVIDISQLETMTASDPELAVEALGIFRQSAGLWGRALDPHADAAQWADAAHGIKGAARSVGLMALGDACEECERLGRAGGATPAQAGVAISSVKDRLGEAIEAIAHVEHQLMMKRSFASVRLG